VVFLRLKAKLGYQYGHDMVEHDDRSNKSSCCTSVIITARQNDKELIRKLRRYQAGKKIAYTDYNQLTCKPHPVKESKKLSDRFNPRN